MHKRVLVWGGAAVALVAAAVLVVYFVRVGLDDADKLAGVIGLFVALAGLGIAVYGLTAHPAGQTAGTTAPRPEPEPDAVHQTPDNPAQADGPAQRRDGSGRGRGGSPEEREGSVPGRHVSAQGPRSVAIGGDNSGIIATGDETTNVQMRAEASGQARIYQAGGDQTINES